MANTIDFNVGTNATQVLNETAEATKNAKQELKELQKQMLSLDAGSAEFQKAAARAGELKDQMNDAADAIRTSTGPALESINSTFSIMSGQIANLDFGGLGQSFTSLGRAVDKINIKSLKDELGGLVKGLGSLAGAIISNPLLALGGAVALLVLNFDKINAALSGTAEKVEKLGQANVTLEKQNKILESKLNIEKISNANSNYAIKLQKEIANNNIKAAQNELEIKTRLGDINGIREAENKLIEARNFLTSITAQQEKDRQGAVDYARSILYKGYKEQLENAKQQQLIETQRIATLDLIKQKESEIGGLRIQESFLIQDNAKQDKKRHSNYVEIHKEEKQNYVEKIQDSDAVKAKQAELNKLIQEEADLKKVSNMLWNGELLKVEEVTKAVAEVIKVQEEAVVQIDNSLAEEFRVAYNAISEAAAEQAKENELRLLSEKDREIQINKEKYDALIAEADLRGLDTTVFLEAQLATEEEIKKKYRDKDRDEAQKLADDKLAKEQEAFNARLSIASSGLNALVALNDAFTKKGQQQSRKQFQIQKALNLASAVIDTYGGINRALNDKTMPSTTARIIQASIVGAMGLANVIKISKTEYGNASAPSGTNMSAGGGDGGGTTAPSPANFAFLQNQPNQQPPLQAYVVSTQVSSNLEAQQLINNQARLGG